MATYSQYTNMYILGNAENLFDYNWRLIRQGDKNDAVTREAFPSIFEERTSSSKPVVSFRGDELSKRGSYMLELTMVDRRHYVES